MTHHHDPSCESAPKNGSQLNKLMLWIMGALMTALMAFVTFHLNSMKAELSRGAEARVTSEGINARQDTDIGYIKESVKRIEQKIDWMLQKNIGIIPKF